jgi:hypothetical protein
MTNKVLQDIGPPWRNVWVGCPVPPLVEEATVSDFPEEILIQASTRAPKAQGRALQEILEGVGTRRQQSGVLSQILREAEPRRGITPLPPSIGDEVHKWIDPGRTHVGVGL